MKPKTSCFWKEFIGDGFENRQLWLFADADWGGEKDSKSTSGCAMVLVGPNTYYPLNAFSNKQTVTSTSSTEAEVVSANHAVRAEGIPTSWVELGSEALESKPNTPKTERQNRVIEFTILCELAFVCLQQVFPNQDELPPSVVPPAWRTPVRV